MKMIEYKFRAEVLCDVSKLLLFLSASGSRYAYTITKADGFPDVEVALNTNMPLVRLKNLMKVVEDGHVMMETVNYKEDYTGERERKQE